MHGTVFPAVAQVALIGVEAHDAAFVQERERLRRLVVVLVHLGQAAAAVIEDLVEDGMRERYRHELLLRKHLLHLASDEGIQAVVVVDMQEAAAGEVTAQVFGLGLAEDDVAVAGHMHERIVEDIGAADLNGGIVVPQLKRRLGVAETDEAGQRSGIGVPVAAATVFEQGDCKA